MADRVLSSRRNLNFQPIFFGWIAAFLTLLSATALGQEVNRASPPPPIPDESTWSPEQAFNFGRYQRAIELARAAQEDLGRFGINESLPVLIANAQLALGKYSDALETIEAGLERYDRGIRVRWVAAEVYRYNDRQEDALRVLKEIRDLASRNSWLYRDTPNQLILGKYFLSQGADAKEVLNSFFKPALKRSGFDVEVYRAMGQLSLDKADYALAAEQFNQLLKIAPNDTDAHYRLAQCYLPSDSELATRELNRTLELNPRHAGSLLIVADRQVSSELYDEAIETLEKILKVNPQQPEALGYRAAIAHLQNDSDAEARFRNQALAHWKNNPEVDHIIGRELSQKYRFREGSQYQRRALIYDDDYLPAKIQLAHDLLRLGQEVEGWKLADEVFDRDQYSVLAHNLVVLRDEMSAFTTLSQDGFVVRMAPEEARIYGDQVLALLEQASTELSEKYSVELETPIVIEIFPRQQDFAIRTFGLPGGDGFLGVCFGRVITMNSPAAQGAGLTSWKSVLWHEFCHVVTLQKTNNKMPRWLSEGISVYEEKQADRAWGESMSQRFREMLLNELTPVSQLSAAFLRPPSPAHLQFAYFESSLVVEYLIDRHGLPALLKVLDELATGMPINDALAKHVEPLDQLDAKFSAYAKGLANDYAPKVDWTQPETVPPTAGIDFWKQWNQEHPNNLPGLLAEAAQWLGEEDPQSALERLEQARSLTDQEPAIFSLTARAYRQLGDQQKERETLEAYAELEASDPELYLRLLELTEADQDWAATVKYADRLLAVNPLIKPPHESLARAAEASGDPQIAVRALRVLAEMNPLDIADVRFRLADAMVKLKQWPEAKRQVLMALEQAPRFRDAHRLLLKINAESEQAP